MNKISITRRRSITIMAAAGAAVAMGAMPMAVGRHDWRGTALGADGRLIFHGIDRSAAQRLIALTVAEIERLEQAFSLYRPDSELSRLNRTAKLELPSHDFRLVLCEAIGFWRRTDGAFNPAVQPLLNLLSRHFATAPEGADPDPAALLNTLALCDPANIALRDDAIRLSPGMAVTLNGIAQGYITDKVTELLRKQGMRNILVQLGETRALPGRVWQLAVKGSGRKIRLRNGAVAVSAGSGARFSKDGRWHHLLDPETGMSGKNHAAVVVRAPTALMADGLSTALAVSEPGKIRRILRRFPQAHVLVQHSDGKWLESASHRETAADAAL